jgi:heptosyltransferase-2
MSVVVRAPNWLGDAVMSLPALEALRNAFPGQHLAALARGGVADIYRLSGLCDEVIVLPSPKGKGGWKEVVRASAALRARKFEIGVLFPNSMESALSLRLTGARQRWGYDRDGRGLLLTRKVSPPLPGDIPRHEVYYYLELLRRLEVIQVLPEDAVPRLHLSEAALERGYKILRDAGMPDKVMALSPGAANSRAKQWPPSYFVEAASLTARETGFPIAVFGTPQETEVCEGIAQNLRERGLVAANLAGTTTLSDFVCAIAVCQVLITNDSGGMHVGYAAGLPTVAIFGPTIEEETGPLGPLSRIVREPVECSPCMLKDCPIDHRCMTRVSAERVSHEALNLVQLR